MLFRPTQKLATKIKLGNRTEKPLEQNELADWSANLFVVNRQQYILLSNTKSLYSCLMPGKGITNESKFVDKTIQSIEKFMQEDGRGRYHETLVLPECEDIHFGKALSRSVTGSMNDHIFAAKIYLQENMDLSEISRRLNVTPMSALRDEIGENYNRPERAMDQILSKQNIK